MRARGNPVSTAAAVALTLVLAVLLVTAVAVLRHAAGPVAGDVDLNAGRVLAGTRVPGEGLSIRLNDRGGGIISFPVGPLDTASASMVTLTLEGASRSGRLLLFASLRESDEPRSVALLDHLPEVPVTLYLGATDGWQGELEALLVGIEGPPRSLVTLKELQLASPTFRNVFANLQGTWSAGESPSARSINVAMEAKEKVIATPWSAALWIALAAVGLSPAVAFLVFRSGAASTARPIPFPAVAGGAFLACWVILDLVWFDHQRSAAADAIERFGPRTADTRPLASSNASLVLIGKRVDAAIGDDADARVFVASADDYRGMRAAYQIYPRRVYWDRHSELPLPQWLRAGDYVLLLAPTTHGLNGDMLQFPGTGGGERRVTRVFQAPDAVFLRVL